MDYNYLAESLAALAGVPVRIYRDGLLSEPAPHPIQAGLRHNRGGKYLQNLPGTWATIWIRTSCTTGCSA